MPAHAQTYPSKPLRIIVPFAQGGAADLLSRMVGQRLQEAWGQPVVVENRTGANGNIGMEAAAKSPPDGYTLVQVPNGNIVVNPNLFAKLPYAQKDFAPVSQIAKVENVLVVESRRRGELGHRAARARACAAGQAQLRVARGRQPGAPRGRVPAPARQRRPAACRLQGRRARAQRPARRADQHDVRGDSVGAAAHQGGQAARARRSRACSARPRCPNVPTVAEQNLPGFEAVSWYSIMVPAGTPNDIIERINGEIARMLVQPEMREKLRRHRRHAHRRNARTIGCSNPRRISALRRSLQARWHPRRIAVPRGTNESRRLGRAHANDRGPDHRNADRRAFGDARSGRCATGRGHAGPRALALAVFPAACAAVRDRTRRARETRGLSPSRGPAAAHVGGQPAALRPAAARRRFDRAPSTIESVNEKSGRSGRLVFVKVRHEIRANGGAEPALTEFHDIVYRDAPKPGDVAPPPQAAPAPAKWEKKWVARRRAALRYSALTFNGHRIHYDRRYVTEVEGYPGLIVHGPLIATLLCDLLRWQLPDARVAAFEFRAVRPLFDLHPFTVCGAAARRRQRRSISGRRTTRDG